MRTILNWLLGGALTASLTWNWKLFTRSEEPSISCRESCAPADCADLALDEEQRRALNELCGRTCGESDRLEQRAEVLHRELLSRLVRPEVDEAGARELVRELTDLRRRSLESCMAGILEVRRVLTPEQVSELVARCGAGPENCR